MPDLRRRALCLLAIAFAVTAAAPAARPPIQHRWSVSIDSRNAAGPWLSVRHGTIFSVRDAHVVAIDLATGRIRWTSAAAVESRPAIGGRIIYAPIVNGIVALDARTGKELGRLRFARTPSLVTADFAAVAIINDVKPGHSRLLGFRDTLHPIWQRDLLDGWGRPDNVGRDTLLVWHTTAAAVIALDARTGSAVAATDGVDDYVGRDRRTLWFSVAGGGLKSLNLDTNRVAAIHNAIVDGAVRVEGRTAVAVVDGRLETLSLPDGRATPLRIDGRWVGGPANQTIFISREDGTYAQRIDGGKSVRIVGNTSSARFLTSTGSAAYFATNDGAIVGVDLTNFAATKPLTTACRFVEGMRVVDGTTLVHCDDGSARSQLYGYTRVAAR